VIFVIALEFIADLFDFGNKELRKVRLTDQNQAVQVSGSKGGTRGDYDDHTVHAMWLGQPYPIKTSLLKNDAADGRQYPELGLGYSGRRST
jgi:hypothetical protein